MKERSGHHGELSLATQGRTRERSGFSGACATTPIGPSLSAPLKASVVLHAGLFWVTAKQDLLEVSENMEGLCQAFRPGRDRVAGTRLEVWQPLGTCLQMWN